LSILLGVKYFYFIVGALWFVTGIYSLLLEHTAGIAGSSSRANVKSAEDFSNISDQRRCRVYGKPDAEVGSLIKSVIGEGI